MTRGRSICNVLKTIRTQIAKANEIEYEPHECHHKGECEGTCPACEAEVRYIERQLDIRILLGKAVTIVGISAGLSALTGCGDKSKKVEPKEETALIDGIIVTTPDTLLSGDVEYRSPEDCTIVEERKATARIRTAKFKQPPKTRPAEEQEQEEQKSKADSLPPIAGDVARVCYLAATMPSFPGGQQSLMDYLTENIQYPEEVCAQGRVIISFVVEKDGSIAEAKVVRSACPELDEEALRVVNSMPKWSPGSMNGVPVRIKYTLPVSFQLQ